VLTYTDASPAPVPPHDDPAEDQTLVELRPSEMDALRVYVRIGALLQVLPAEGLAERVRTAHLDRPGSRWSLGLDAGQIESVAYAFYLRSMGGSVAEANRFARESGVAFRADRSTSSLRLTRLS
jgi:hypothetical protein